MTPPALEELLAENPTQAFLLKLNSGDEIILDSSRRAFILGLELYLGIGGDPDSMIGKSLRVVSIPNISIIQPIDRLKLYRKGRRRR